MAKGGCGLPTHTTSIVKSQFALQHSRAPRSTGMPTQHPTAISVRDSPATRADVTGYGLRTSSAIHNTKLHGVTATRVHGVTVTKLYDGTSQYPIRHPTQHGDRATSYNKAKISNTKIHYVTANDMTTARATRYNNNTKLHVTTTKLYDCRLTRTYMTSRQTTAWRMPPTSRQYQIPNYTVSHTRF
jgi:hypothetical protein